MPRVRWEALKNEVIAKMFMETAENKIGAMEEGRGDSTRWTEVAGKLVEAVKEQCRSAERLKRHRLHDLWRLQLN